MAKIQRLEIDLVANTGKLQKGFKRGRIEVKSFTATVSRSSAGLKRWAASIVAAVGGFMLLRKAVSSIREAMVAVDKLAKTSDKLGIATEKLAGLGHAAELTGVGTDKMQMALQRMVRRVSEAAKGTGEAQGALAELNLDAAKLSQLSPDEQLRKIAEAFGKVSGSGDKVRLAFKLFDAEGVSMVNMLKNGKVGLDAMTADAERLGVAITRVDAAKIEMANDAFTRMKAAISGAAQRIAVQLAPMLESVIGKITEFLATRDWESIIDNVVQVSIRAAGAVGEFAKQIAIQFQQMKIEVLTIMESLATSTANLLAMLPGGGSTREVKGLRAYAAGMQGIIDQASEFRDKLEGVDVEAVLRAAIDSYSADFEARAAEAAGGAIKGIGADLGEDIAEPVKEAAKEARRAIAGPQALTQGSQGAASVLAGALNANKSREEYWNKQHDQVGKDQLSELRAIATSVKFFTYAEPAVI